MLNYLKASFSFSQNVSSRNLCLVSLYSLQFSPSSTPLRLLYHTLEDTQYPYMMLTLHTFYRTMNRTQNTEKSRQVSIRNESQCDIYGATSITATTTKLHKRCYIQVTTIIHRRYAILDQERGTLAYPKPILSCFCITRLVPWLAAARARGARCALAGLLCVTSPNFDRLTL